MNNFTDWLINDAEDCGMLTPPMEAQQCVDMLQSYLLGEDWYVTSGVTSAEQINTEIVFEILSKYSKKFRKEWKQCIKNNRRRIKSTD